MRTLVASFLLVIVACATTGASTETREGGQVCLGCRLYRVVQLGSTCTVVAETPTACSAWVAENAPNHEHAWTEYGCWTVKSKDGERYDLGADPVILSVPDEKWLAYLQSLPRDRLARAVGPDWPGSEESLREVASWQGVPIK